MKFRLISALGAVVLLTASPDAKEIKLLATWSGHRAAVRDVDFSPNGKTAVSVSDDETVRMWRVSSGKTLFICKHNDFVDSVKFLPDGKRFITGSADGTVARWNAKNGKRLNSWISQHPGAVMPGDEGSELRAIDYGHDGSEVRSFLVPDERSDALGVSPDGRWALSGGRYEQMVLFDLHKGTVAAVWHTRNFIFDIDFSTDNTKVLTANWAKVIEVRDVATGKRVGAFFGHEGVVRAVSYSPDGKTVISGSRDRTIRVWDAATHEQMAVWKGHERAVIELAISPDGTRVASVGEDAAIRIWDVATGEELAVLKGHAGAVFAVAYSPDGRKILTTGADRTLRLWDVSRL